MLEVVGKEVTGKLRRPPHDEGGIVFSPRDYMVGGGVVNKLIRFREKRSWN